MTKVAKIAVPSPLHQVFDYYWPDHRDIVEGLRVTVPFGRRTVVGLVMGSSDVAAVASSRMKRVTTIHDPSPVLPTDVMKLLRWASDYYHHPIGDVLASALPVALRKGADAATPTLVRYRVQTGAVTDPELLKRAPLQKVLLQRLQESGESGLDADGLKDAGSSWRKALQQLIERGWIEQFEVDNLLLNRATEQGPELTSEQSDAIKAVSDTRDKFRAFILNGVTGSGKTEVYLRLIREQTEAGRQVLVLVPEISLTPQLLDRFRRRIPGCIVSLHSGLNDTERLNHWMLASSGKADVVIGTRSAIFTPLPRLGLIVIDEEHDASLKQQDGFRYHARDLALMRARDASCPVLLGSATPSLETLSNVSSGRYSELRLTKRAGEAEPPEITLLDIRRRKLTEGMSDRLLAMIKEQLDQDGQVLVFLNRRGFAPTLLCNDCGAAAECQRCDAHMTVHGKLNCLRCHHCGAERAVPSICESCESERLDRVGQGTERIEAALRLAFPDVEIARIDRDTTRRKGALKQQLDDAASGKSRILVGTQMLAKGHHFPNVTLVSILDIDRGLYGVDFRAQEQMGQLIVQVAGRAGRERRRGKVLVQTRNPDNLMLQTLVADGYGAFADRLLDERRETALPPFSYVSLVRAEATDRSAPEDFLRMVRDSLGNMSSLNDGQSEAEITSLELFGPVAAPMERVGGRYRFQLLVQAARRKDLNSALRQLRVESAQFSLVNRVRWSIDVDPVDFY